LSGPQIASRYHSDSQRDFSSRFIDPSLFDTLPQGYELFLGQAVMQGKFQTSQKLHALGNYRINLSLRTDQVAF
jgi:hypothetical protein